MRCLRRRTPYGPHHGSRKRQHHPRPRPSQSMPQPRQTLRAPSPTPSLCQSWEAILGRRPKTRGHAPRNGCHSHAKLCEHRLLRRLCASLGRLSILGRRPRTPRSTRVASSKTPRTLPSGRRSSAPPPRTRQNAAGRQSRRSRRRRTADRHKRSSARSPSAAAATRRKRRHGQCLRSR